MGMKKGFLYLSGSIEYSNDPASWRNYMEKRLFRHYNIFNPAAQFCPLEKNDPDYPRWIHDKFIVPDLSFVMQCTHFFVKIDKACCAGAGTWGELTFAAYLNKHIVYYFDDIQIQDIPGWVLGCLCSATEVYNIDSAIDVYIKLAEREGI